MNRKCSSIYLDNTLYTSIDLPDTIIYDPKIDAENAFYSYNKKAMVRILYFTSNEHKGVYLNFPNAKQEDISEYKDSILSLLHFMILNLFQKDNFCFSRKENAKRLLNYENRLRRLTIELFICYKKAFPFQDERIWVSEEVCIDILKMYAHQIESNLESFPDINGYYRHQFEVEMIKAILNHSLNEFDEHRRYLKIRLSQFGIGLFKEIKKSIDEKCVCKEFEYRLVKHDIPPKEKNYIVVSILDK